jgi:hypothetical protein
MTTPALLVALSLLAAEPAPAATNDPAQAEPTPAASKADAAKPDAKKGDAAKPDEKKAEEKKAEEKKGDAAAAAEPKPDAAPEKKAEATADAPKGGDAGPEGAKAEPPKADAAAQPPGADAAKGGSSAAEAVPEPPPAPAAAAGAPATPPPELEPVPGSPAAALLAAEAAPPAPPPAPPGKDYPSWGLTIDGGFPDTGGLGLLWRPWHWLRFEGSATTTVYGPYGYRAGVSLVPFLFPITPTLTVNYGRVLEGDWNKLATKAGAKVDPEVQPVLRKLGYQYVDAHVGLELGAPRRFVFFVRAGLSQVWTTLHNLTPMAQSKIKDSSTTVTIADTKLTVRGIPSAKVGFLIYLF